MGIINAAQNFLNPTQPGNIWNTPALRALQTPLVGVQKFLQPQQAPTPIPLQTQQPPAFLSNLDKIGRFLGNQQILPNPLGPQGAGPTLFKTSQMLGFPGVSDVLSGNIEGLPAHMAQGEQERQQGTRLLGQKNLTPQQTQLAKQSLSNMVMGTIGGVDSAVGKAATLPAITARDEAVVGAIGDTPAVREGMNRLNSLTQTPVMNQVDSYAQHLENQQKLAQPPTNPNTDFMQVFQKFAQTKNISSLSPAEKEIFLSHGVDAPRDAGIGAPPGFGAWHDNILGHPSSDHTPAQLAPEIKQYVDSGAVNNPTWNYALPKENTISPLQSTEQRVAQFDSYAKHLQDQQAFLSHPLSQEAHYKPPTGSQKPDVIKNPNTLSPLGQRMGAVNEATTKEVKGKQNPLAQFESKNISSPKENIAYFDKSGNKLYQSEQGRKYSAGVTKEIQDSLFGKAVVSSHNHRLADIQNPNSPLNQAAIAPDKFDMSNAISHGIKEVRTTSPLGTTSVKFPDNMSQDTVRQAFQKAGTDGEIAYRKALADGKSPYMANAARVAVENQSIIDGIGATLSHTPSKYISPVVQPPKNPKGVLTQTQPSFLSTAVATARAKVGNLFGRQPEKPSTFSVSYPKERGFISTVKESPQAPQELKTLVGGNYEPKSNITLIKAANDRIAKSPSSATQFALKENTDEATATAIQLVKQLSDQGSYQAAADIVSQKAEQLTEAGRAIQAASLFNSLSPEGIGQLAAQTIARYNAAAKQQIPQLSARQFQTLVTQAEKMKSLPLGSREYTIAAHTLIDKVRSLIPSSWADKAITIWKAGLLTSLRTHERNILGNSLHLGAETVKDIPATVADKLIALKTGKRTITPTLQGMGQGAKKGVQAFKDILQTGYDPEQAISKYDVKSIVWGNNPFEQAMKKYTDVVFRTLGGADKPFWNAAYARSLYDQAGAQAINAGAKGNAQYIGNLVQKPTETMMKSALQDANVATFHNKTMLSNVANSFKRAASKNEITKIGSEVLAPFTGVPSAVAGQMVAYSPLGLIKGIADAGRVVTGKIPDLQRQAAQEIGRGVIGTGLIGLGAYLMKKDLMTGQPRNSQELNQWQLEGKSPNSVLVGGKWRSIGSVGPELLLLLAGAKYQQDNGDTGKFLGDVGKDFLSQTFLQGVQQPLAAVTDPQRYGSSYIGNQASSAIPNIVKDTAKANDPFVRENNSTKDYLTNAIPGLRNKNVAKRDVLGKPLFQEPTGIGAYIDLFNSKTPQTNSVISELSRLNAVGNIATPSKLGKNQTVKGIKAALTPQQLDAFESQAGTQTMDALQKLFASPQYKSLSDQDKQNEVSKIVAATRKTTRATFSPKGNLSPGSLLKSGETPSYATSTDSPKNILDKALLYGHGLLSDTGGTFHAITTGQPLRKITGNAAIVERQNFLNTARNGMVLDHVIPLSIGGANDPSNLAYQNPQSAAQKDMLEKQLYTQLNNGQITKADAQKQMMDYVTKGNEQLGSQLVKSPSKTTKSIKSKGLFTKSKTGLFKKTKNKGLFNTL